MKADGGYFVLIIAENGTFLDMVEQIITNNNNKIITKKGP